MTEPPINRLRLDYEVKINRLQNSLIVRALIPIYIRMIKQLNHTEIRIFFFKHHLLSFFFFHAFK